MNTGVRAAHLLRPDKAALPLTPAPRADCTLHYFIDGTCAFFELCAGKKNHLAFNYSTLSSTPCLHLSKWRLSDTGALGKAAAKKAGLNILSAAISQAWVTGSVSFIKPRPRLRLWWELKWEAESFPLASECLPGRCVLPWPWHIDLSGPLTLKHHTITQALITTFHKMDSNISKHDPIFQSWAVVILAQSPAVLCGCMHSCRSHTNPSTRIQILPSEAPVGSEP